VSDDRPQAGTPGRVPAPGGPIGPGGPLGPDGPLGHIGLEKIRDRWRLFVGAGIGLALLGVVAVAAATVTTVVSVLVLAWLLLFAGAAQLFHAFSHRDWSGFFVDLLLGVLYTATGVVFLLNPMSGAEVLTLVMAVFFLVGGGFRLVTAITSGFPHKGWLALSGVVDVVLGALIWSQWPGSGLWVIGLFVGIDLLFAGTTLLMLGLRLRQDATG